MKLQTIATIVLILAVIGLVDSVYATYEHYEYLKDSASKAFCDISSEISCSAVNGSEYSEIFGIPVAATGAAWFVVTIVLALEMRKKTRTGFWKNAPFYLFVWSVIGLFSIMYFIYVELFLIGSICILCTIVHIIVVITLLLSYKALEKPIGKYISEIFYK